MHAHLRKQGSPLQVGSIHYCTTSHVTGPKASDLLGKFCTQFLQERGVSICQTCWWVEHFKTTNSRKANSSVQDIIYETKRIHRELQYQVLQNQNYPECPYILYTFDLLKHKVVSSFFRDQALYLLHSTVCIMR